MHLTQMQTTLTECMVAMANFMLAVSNRVEGRRNHSRFMACSAIPVMKNAADDGANVAVVNVVVLAMFLPLCHLYLVANSTAKSRKKLVKHLQLQVPPGLGSVHLEQQLKLPRDRVWVHLDRA